MSRVHEALQRVRSAGGRRVGVASPAAAVAQRAGGSVVDQYEREAWRPAPPDGDDDAAAWGFEVPRTAGVDPQGRARHAVPASPEATVAVLDDDDAGQGLLFPPPVQEPDEPQASRPLPGPAAELPMIAPSGPNPAGAEQYRRLAASLYELQVERGLTTVMVTSAEPEDGKTLTAVNLALALSGSYDRHVLLVDADLRRASIHEILGVPNERGLSDVLEGGREELPIHELTPRLSVLPAGRASADPLAGLSSERLTRVLETCAQRFDWVILDTPPVGPMPDAQLLAHLIQAVVFVIRAGVTPLPAVERAIADLGRDSIVGAVLNDVNEEQVATGYYHDRR